MSHNLSLLIDSWFLILSLRGVSLNKTELSLVISYVHPTVVEYAKLLPSFRHGQWNK